MQLLTTPSKPWLNNSRNLRGGGGGIGSTVTTDEELLSSVHRNLVGTPVVQAAETILPGGQTPIEWTVNAVVHSGLCGASTSNIKTAKWTGVENASKEIQWNSVTVSGGTGFPCTYERASSTATFITHYLGDGFGVMPTHVSLPMYTNMKKFTIQHKEPALCAGTTSAVTSWYGKPCDTNNNAATMIEWQYMESTTVGANVIIHCLGTPQWRRGYMGNGQGTTDWLGYCGTSATHANFLPLKFEYVTYKTSHKLSQLCADSNQANPATESIWIGEECTNGSGGYRWDKVATPMFTDTTSGNCGPRVPTHDRTITTGSQVVAQTFIDEFMGNSCTVGPTNTQLGSVPPNGLAAPSTGPTNPPVPAPTNPPVPAPTNPPVPAPTSPPVPLVGPLQRSFATYDAPAITAFCDSFVDGQKCCTSDVAGTTVDVANVCPFQQFKNIWLADGACQGANACANIAPNLPTGTHSSFQLDSNSCQGDRACFGIAQSTTTAPPQGFYFNIDGCRGTEACMNLGSAKASSINVSSTSCIGNASCKNLAANIGEAIWIRQYQCFLDNSCTDCQKDINTIKSGSTKVELGDYVNQCASTGVVAPDPLPPITAKSQDFYHNDATKTGTNKGADGTTQTGAIYTNNGTWDPTAIKQFCESFDAGHRCCTSDIAGTKVDVLGVCTHFSKFYHIRLHNGACQGQGSCSTIADRAPFTPATSTTTYLKLGVNACQGLEACFFMARASVEARLSIGHNACQGEQSCSRIAFARGTTVDVKDNSCQKFASCRDAYAFSTTVVVETNQCNANAYACERCLFDTAIVTVADSATQCPDPGLYDA